MCASSGGVLAILANGEASLARVNPQLSQLEKRDWELWAIISVTGVLVSATLLAILFHAAFLKNDGIHFELTVGVLKASIRGSDAAVRYGGDEFLILLADTTLEGSENVVQRIHGKLEEWNACDHLEGFRVA